jgi:thiol-disulfide isomerase/thioredoxin
MLVENLDLKTFKSLRDQGRPSLIKFYSNGCHYCHKLSGLLEGVAENFPDLKFYKINIDKYPTMPKALGFNGVPTILLYNVVPNKKYYFFEEPDYPNNHTWYSKLYIERNIKKYYGEIKK